MGIPHSHYCGEGQHRWEHDKVQKTGKVGLLCTGTYTFTCPPCFDALFRRVRQVEPPTTPPRTPRKTEPKPAPPTADPPVCVINHIVLILRKAGRPMTIHEIFAAGAGTVLRSTVRGTLNKYISKGHTIRRARVDGYYELFD